MNSIYLSITPFFPTSEHFAGPFIYDQVKAIERTGKFDRVIVMRPDKSNSEYTFKGVPVYGFKVRLLPSNILPGLFDSCNQKSFLHRLASLQIRLSDVIVAHAHVAAQALYVNAVKELNPGTHTVIQYHDPDPYSIRLGRLKRQLWHRKIVACHSIKLCNKVDLHVGVSQKVIDNLLSFPFPTDNEVYEEYKALLLGMEKLSPVKSKNTYVLYNGVDTNFFFSNRTGTENNIFRVGCVANFADWKSQITLIKAVEILSKKDNNIEVVFMGSGPTLSTCKEYVQKHQLENHITFQSEKEHHLLPVFYNSLDLFVLPSYFEGFGCVFTEAYACGIPFMTCINQGITEYIRDEDKDKWLFPPNDHLRLAILIGQYKKKRFLQSLKLPYDIDTLISGFLKRFG